MARLNRVKDNKVNKLKAINLQVALIIFNILLTTILLYLHLR